MTVLDPSASQAFAAGNGAQISLNSCGITVNSASPSAFYATGSARVDAASIQVVGGASVVNGATATPTPSTGATAAGDPFVAVAPPTASSCLTHPDYTQWGANGHYELNPGTYCGGLRVANGVTAHLNPGVYVVSGGGVRLEGGSVSGTGVTIYITGDSFTANQPVAINNGVTVNLTAPTSGPYQGLLFFQDRTINNSLLASNFGGGASMSLTGALYFPTTSLTFNNGSTSAANTAIIARTISFQGGVGIKLNPAAAAVLPPASVSVAPVSASLYGGQTQQFSATVTGACTGGVTWSLSPAGAGALSAAGLYTAPATISAQQTVTITATSQSDPTRSASATVTLRPPVAVGVGPSTATLYGGQTQQFSATVTNTANTAVVWSISPAGVGTVSGSGAYTAPATVTAQQTVNVIATSAADPSKSGVAIVTLSPPVAISLAPQTATLYEGQSRQFTATLSNTPNASVTWTLSPPGAGSITGSGLYTAPASVSAQQTVTVTAISQADTSKSSSAVITLLPAISVSVTPPTATAYAGQTQQFAAAVSNTANTAVTWTISPVGAGTISGSGLYSAPAVIAAQQSVTVTATSQADAAKSASATVTLTPLSVTVTPSTVTLYGGQNQQFSATVTNSANTQVTWTLSPAGVGTITAAGMYTAPAVVSSQQSVTITATSQADGTKSATATVTLAGPITVSVAPFTATLYGGQSQQFAATLANTSNTAVTWTVTPAGAGTITSAGLYTAPATVSAQQTVAVTATSQSDPSRSATATITLSPPITVTVTPPTSTLYGGQTQQFSATVENSSNTTVTWTISPAGAGTITSAGLYTAPATVSAQQTVAVTATSQSDPSRSATATITLSPPITVTVTPSTATLYGGQTQQFAAAVANTSNTTVTWSVSAGTITSGGLYTAPATVNTQQTVTVTATSQSDPSRSATATIMLSPPITVTVTPGATTLYGGQTQQFSAMVANSSNAAVTWTINPSAGAGTITSGGLYAAPATVSTQQTVTITATSQGDPTRFATATITLSPPVSITVAPQTAVLYGGQTQQFAATVTNSANTAVNWSVAPVGAGTIDASGIYTAPATIATRQDVTITATSQVDSTRSATTVVTLSPPVSITVGPTSATLYAGQTQQFTGTVLNASDSSIVWSLSPAGAGVISAAGLYTAPATIANQQTVTVTAKSQFDPTKTASAAITLFPPITVTVTPPTATASGGQTQQFTATVANATNPAVTWAISPAGAGSIDAAGLYTAPTNVSAQQTVTVTAASQVDATKYGTATITLQSLVTVSVSPATATVFAGNTQQFSATVAGSANTAVTWELSPAGVGTISAAGLYTAPAAVTAGQTVSVIARSAADPVRSGSVTVTLVPVTSLAPIRVNAGGPAYIDPQGLLWSASNGFTLKGTTNVPASFSFAPPAGRNVPIIYQTGLSSNSTPIQYQTALPNGQYAVTLKFADSIISFDTFDVSINGTNVLPHLNVMSIAGQYNPWDATFPVTVTDGQITILFTPTSWYAVINAIQIVPANSVEVLPRNPALTAQQFMQFTANIQGASSQAVTWSISPNVGSISASGLYQAPSSLEAPTAVTVTATNVVNPSLSGSSTISLSAVTASSFAPIRVNAGGPAYMDAQGLLWSASSGFTLQGTANVPAAFSFTPPAGSNIPVIYQTGLNTNSTSIEYQAAVPNGQYAVTLKFADSLIGFDTFDVSINGVAVLSRLNVISTVGQYNPWDATFPVNVTDGQITVVFSPTSWNAVINAIQIVAAGSVEVLPRNPALSSQQALQFTANVQGTSSQAVTWTLNPNVGTISPAGLYQAPASLQTPTAVTVTATSVDNPSLSGSSTVAVGTATATTFTPIRVNAGGPTYTDPQGLVWSASNGFTLQGTSNIPAAFSFTPPVGSTTPVVYRTGLYSNSTPIQYQATVPNGQYVVTLKFADSLVSFDTFDISINGAAVLTRLNVMSTVGQYNPWDVTFPVNVTDGRITILFSPTSWYAVINAIQILAAGQVEVSPLTATPWQSQSVQFRASVANVSNQNVTWSVSPAGAGSISAAGLYTAPASIPAKQTVTVTATGVAAPNLSASAVVNLWPPSGVGVSPQTVSLTPGQSRQFTGTPNNGSTLGVTWSASPVEFGSITQAGVYTAPATIYAPQTVTITATSIADGSIGTATITLTPATTVSVSPTTATAGPSQFQRFTATVGGAWNSAVMWSITPAVGAISPDGVYTAPAIISTTSTATVTATSVANPAVAATATLTLTPAQPGVSVTVSPATASVTTGQAQQFAAAVAGTANTAVSWSINPKVGTISATGQYVAPADVTTPQTVTVQAISAAFPSVSGTASMVVSPVVTNNYTYRRPIVIDHTKVANTDQTGFPVQITGKHPYLASVGSGGKVQNANGYDLIFTSDCAGLQRLDHKTVSYAASDGTVSIWVILPQLSHTTDTVFYISYGSSAITTSQENRTAVDDALNPAVTRTADWLATMANNQNSPAAFYTTYPENANSIAPSAPTLAGTQSQQFLPLFLTTAAATRSNPLTLLGTVATPSNAQSIAVSGTTAYLCDDNEVAVVDISDPANPRFVSSALSTTIKNSGNIHCSVQGNSLLVFSDAVNSVISGSPAFTAFDITNPRQPQLIAGTAVNRRFFDEPSYNGNTAIVPTGLYTYSVGTLSGSFGQVFSANIANVAAPVVQGVLLQPDNNGTGPNSGYISGGTLYNSQLFYATGSTSVDNFGNWNSGTGKLLVVDVSSPAAMTLIQQVNVAGTKTLYKPQIQGSLAVALGDNGGVGLDFPDPNQPFRLGNITVTTFDLADPRNPKVLTTLTSAYKPGLGGGSAQIGDNLFLFGGVRDSANRDIVLLVDTINPRNPVLTAYPVPAPVTRMTAVGNILHTSNRGAGYAAYRIPGVTPAQFSLSGACGGPVTWTLSPSGVGAITAAGVYTAPANFTNGQTVLLTATSQADSTQNATATVTLSNVLLTTLSLTSAAPAVVGGPAGFLATVTSQSGAPVSGVNLTLTVTGANARTLTGVTDANGRVVFSYAGSARGTDTVQVGTTANGGSTSNSVSLTWFNPVNTVTTTAISGRFFAMGTCQAGCEAFTTAPSEQPVFTQSFPDLMFNTGVDTVLDGGGASVGTIATQGSADAAVFRGTFLVKQAGNYTFTIASADGFLFGVAGATRVSGVYVNAPASGVTPFAQFPVMAANNGVSTGTGNPVVVNFPAAGSYPYEVDYRIGGTLTFGVRPLHSLVVTATTSAARAIGQQATFTVQAKDETGAVVASLPVTITVGGANPQTLLATTDVTGTATVSYSGTATGADLVQATASINGQTAISNQGAVTWSVNQAPQISVTGDAILQLPNRGTYTATVTDPAAPAGGAISVQWTQVSGPGTVSFDLPQQKTVHAAYPAPGNYVLQIAATDLLGTSTLEVPVRVDPPVTTAQGWIGSPLDHATLTGVVPITVASGVTLASGTLSYYPASNPTAVVTLNANTTGSGQIGALDTTLLPNGTYYVLLYATDTTGKTMSSGIWIVVGGDYKPGRVTTTVTDLVVPAPGLPIRIDRTYDSLVRSTSSDFGYGWSLGIKVQLEIGNTQDVTLTLNGQRRTFYFTPTSTILGIYSPAYTGEPGLFGKLENPASNCGAGGTNQLVKTGNIYVCAIGYDLFQPQTLVYTDPYGRVYTVGGDGSLRSLKDVANNTLTVTATGITSSNGLSIPFVRDAQGRITKITDPLGNEYAYGYDASGNLTSVTYPGVTTPAAYTYDTSHLYTGGTDPRGNALPGTQYYSDGKLKSVTDAAGKTTGYAYDLATRTTTITNPDGGKVVRVDDSYGKPLTVTDPLNHTTTNVYDANHNLTSVTDPLGHTTTYGYDANGNRTSVKLHGLPASQTVYNTYGEPTQTTDEIGNVRTFGYDGNFWPKLASDGIGPVVSFTFNANGTMASKAVGYDLAVTSGKATTYTYDAYGNLASETDALGRTTTYVYDSLGRKTSMTTAGSGTTTYTYDALGHVKTESGPLGRNKSYGYDANGNKTSETDANGKTTTYQYDALNRLSLVTYPTTPATTTSYSYDFRNNVIDTTDQAGRVTHNLYDLAGRLTSTTVAYGTADAATISYTYHDDGRKKTETDAGGHTTTYNYDAAGRLTSVVDAQGHTTQYAYDDAGNQTSFTDANLHKTLQQYDSRRRLQKTTYNDGTTTQYGYDGPGNLTSVTDQAGRVVQYAYDAANQLRSLVQVNHPDPSHNTTNYGYDANGNLTTLTDANSHTTQNAFDVLNQLKTETMPSGTLTQTRTYDPAGNLISLKDYNGRTTTYTYDVMNRLLTKTPDPSLGEVGVTFTYTATGKRASMTDASGVTTYTYDNLDRLKTKATPQGALSYTYDAAGNVASINSSNANGVSIGYTWDNLNRLSTVVDNRLPAGRNTTIYTYDLANNLGTVMYPNGTSSAFVYDSLNRLTAVNGYSYTLGPTGHRTSATEPGGRTLSWSYDGAYRLTQETSTLDLNSNSGTVTYGLDPVGNRLSQTSTVPQIATGSFTYDANDRLSTETYDNNGNTLAFGSKSFAYDFENRLKAVNGGAVTIVYDGDGNRVTKAVGGTTVQYLVDELNPSGYPQVVEVLSAGAVSFQYTIGLQRISQNYVSSSGWDQRFYGYDGRGNVTSLWDFAAAKTDTYNYDAWGRLLGSTGNTPNVYRYRAEEFDTDLDLYYLRARYYAPMTGRFLSRDTYENRSGTATSLNRYVYSSADPVNRVDPTGHLDAGEYGTLATLAERGWTIGRAGSAVFAGVAIGAYIACIWEKSTSVLHIGGIVDLLDPGIRFANFRLISACGHAIDTYSPTSPPTPEGQPDTNREPSKEPSPEPEPCRDPGAEGKDVHGQWNPGSPQDGWRKEFPVPGGRIDGVNLRTHLVLELKPCNGSALCKGRSQLRRYIEALERVFPGTKGLWIGRTICYERNASGGYDFHYQ